MRLVDTHTHAWGNDTTELPWKEELLPPGWSGSYTHHDLVADMDRLGIDESVVVTTPLYGRGRRANEYMMRGIEAYPDRLYGVGLVGLFTDEERVRQDIRRVTGHDRVLGIRMHAALSYEEHPTEVDRTGDWITSPELKPVWDELARSDTTLFILPKAEQLGMITDLAADHPGVQIVVDHMGWPDKTTDPDEMPWVAFRRLSEQDNVYVKLSSLPRSAEQPWPYSDLHGYVRNLIEWFGPERLMIGSDYPWMDRWGSYEECLFWIEETEFLSARDLAYLSYRTFDIVRS